MDRRSLQPPEGQESRESRVILRGGREVVIPYLAPVEVNVPSDVPLDVRVESEEDLDADTLDILIEAESGASIREAFYWATTTEDFMNEQGELFATDEDMQAEVIGDIFTYAAIMGLQTETIDMLYSEALNDLAY